MRGPNWNSRPVHDPAFPPTGQSSKQHGRSAIRRRDAHPVFCNDPSQE
jgi:hypothetical protein